MTIPMPFFTRLPLLLCLMGTQASGNARLPDIGDSATTVFSPQYERRLGHAFLRYLRGAAPLVTDQALQGYIQSLGERIARHSDEPDRRFIFVVVFDDAINAFAGPGGVIGINTGVLLNSRNESELAGVLAHEIAHVTQHHLARAFERGSRYQLPLAAAVLGALVLGASNPDLGIATAAAVQGLGIQSQLNFTRTNEQEADRVGMQFLARAGFAPTGMPNFFKRLLRKNLYHQGAVPEFLRTHPLTTSRIADSEARARQMNTPDPGSSLEYELMRARTEVYSIRSVADAAKHYAERLSGAEGSTMKEEAIRYGYALALLRKGDFVAARQQAEILLAARDSAVQYLILAADIELESRNYPRALEWFETAYRLYPNDKTLLFSWCRGLLDAEQPARARTLLRNWRQHNAYRQDLEFFDLLSQAEAQSGYQAEGTIAKTEYFYLLGNTELAIDQLEFAENQLQLSNYLKQRVNARRMELEKELELERALKIRNFNTRD